MADNKFQTTVQTVVSTPDSERPVTAHANPSGAQSSPETPADQIDEEKKGFFAYFRTKEFYITLILG